MLNLKGENCPREREREREVLIGSNASTIIAS